MKKEHPFSWVQKVSAEIRSPDEIPLFGRAPPFDWHHFSALLSSKLGIQRLGFQPKRQQWLPPEEMAAGLGTEILVIPVHLSPLTPPIFWAMGKGDREKFTSWMLSGQSQGRTFTSDVLQEGYYRFLLLEVLDTVQSLSPIDQLTLSLVEEGTIPEAESFCVDVELSFDEHACWGRLILTPEFRRAWIHHFASTPSEYTSTPLSEKLPLILGVKAGSIRLNQEEWRNLQLGDFIPLDSGSYDSRKGAGMATLTLGLTPLFQAKIKQNKIEILDYAFIQEDIMQEHTPSQEEIVPIKDLPIDVIVEISRLKITLDKLMGLNPGNMLELPIHPDQGVTLTVNGQKVGRAELVHLGEALGIRILEIS